MQPYDHAWKERQIGTNGSEDNRWWLAFTRQYRIDKGIVNPAEALREGAYNFND